MTDKDFIFGIRAVIEAIDSGKEVNKLMVQKGLQGDLWKELHSLLKANDIPYQFVPIEKLNRVTRKNHQGVVCFLSPVTYHTIEQLLPTIYEAGKTPALLMLDRITDVRNFGAIARTAECMGIDAIIIPEKGSALITSDAVKTSAGALHRIPVCRAHNLKNTIEYLTECGLQIVACTEKTDNVIYNVNFALPTLIIMGSEEDGISGEYIKRSTVCAKIPMRGHIASFNVSVATGVILYELVRQRDLSI